MEQAPCRVGTQGEVRRRALRGAAPHPERISPQPLPGRAICATLAAMHIAFRVAGAAALSLALGLASAQRAVRAGFAGGEVANGPWRTSFVTGSADADPYTRARVAVGGLLALAPSETVYWTAESDGEGRPLDARCGYRIEGEELPARWWSLTLYGADQFLVANDASRFSFSQTTLAREPGGPWTVEVSSEPRPGNWLPSGRAGAAGPFSLTLRLYNPAPPVYEQPERMALPRIARGECR
jgi:hypothetical protein